MHDRWLSDCFGKTHAAYALISCTFRHSETQSQQRRQRADIYGHPAPPGQDHRKGRQQIPVDGLEVAHAPQRQEHRRGRAPARHQLSGQGASRPRADHGKIPHGHHPVLPVPGGRRGLAQRPHLHAGLPLGARAAHREPRHERPPARGRGLTRARPDPPLPGPRPAARQQHLRHVLPPLHAQAQGRRPRLHPRPRGPAAGHRIHPRHAPGARRPALGRRPAAAPRRDPGLAADGDHGHRARRGRHC